MNKRKCRVCLSKGLLINVFHKQNTLMISTKLMSLAKVQIHPNDGLPQTICQKCVRKLDNCIKFVQLCQDSDLKLRSHIEGHDTKAVAKIDIDLQNIYNEGFDKYSPKSDKDSVDENSISEEVFVKEEVNRNIPNDITICNQKKIKQQCFTCGKVMSSRFRLKTHLRTHTGERPFSCPHCNKTFSLAQSLKVHLRVHTGEKPLSCTDCGATFAHYAGLSAHKRKHTGLTPYRCVLCPRSFRTNGHLQYHIRRHTGEKNFECNECSRAFITRSDLKQHLLTHSGDKPHICCICGLRLTRATHLRRHIQFIHKGDKSFACSECPSKFSQKGAYEKHKKNHELTNVEKT